MTTVRRRIVLLVLAAIMALTMVAGPTASGAFALTGGDDKCKGDRDNKKCPNTRDGGVVLNGGGHGKPDRAPFG